MRMRILVDPKYRLALASLAMLLLLYPLGKCYFTSGLVAFASGFIIILASGYVHAKRVRKQLEGGEVLEPRDSFASIEDPYELYDDEQAPTSASEDIDAKELFRQERQKQKRHLLRDAKFGLKSSLSLLRLGAYGLLVLGFIALVNNHLLHIPTYLGALLPGIAMGYLFLKD